jgi:hypothetical protein
LYYAQDAAAMPVEHWGAQIPLALLIMKVSSKSVSLEKASSNPFWGEVQVKRCSARTRFIGPS